MKNTIKIINLIVLFIFLLSSSFSNPLTKFEKTEYNSYKDLIQKTVNMTINPKILNMISEKGLSIINVAWNELSGQKKKESVFDVSDITVQVAAFNPSNNIYFFNSVPEIRYPDFNDRTSEVAIDKLFLYTGNEKGNRLQAVCLNDILENVPKYLTRASSWKSKNKSLILKNEKYIRINAQVSLLPVSSEGTADFTPVIFNQKAFKNNPAVLSILATKNGTSITVIDNAMDIFEPGQSFGQKLFFNKNGLKTNLNIKRNLNEISETDESKSEKLKETKTNKDINIFTVIQVPLKQKNPQTSKTAQAGLALEFYSGSNIENTAEGLKKNQGPFREIDNLSIERDFNQPIIMTVQFLKTIVSSDISDKEISEIKTLIDRIYSNPDYIYSLLIANIPDKPSESSKDKKDQKKWWDIFPKKESDKQKNLK